MAAQPRGCKPCRDSELREGKRGRRGKDSQEEAQQGKQVDTWRQEDEDMFRHHEKVLKHRSNRKGCKRSTRSEAEEEGSGKADVIIFQPPTKKAKEDTVGH